MSFEETKWILFTITKEHKHEVKLWEHYIGGGGEISKWEMGIKIIYITKMGIMLQKWGLSNASKNCFECHGYQYAISQTQKLKITGN